MILPGDKVLVFDPVSYKDDIKTPLKTTMKPATVIRSYGRRDRYGIYSNLIDVKFDHRPNVISHGHFADGVKKL